MNLSKEISEIDVNGLTPIPDIEKASIKREIGEQKNPPSSDYEKDFVASSIEG